MLVCMAACWCAWLHDGVLYYCHQHTPLTCMPGCSDPVCPKNHIKLFKNRSGLHGELSLVHFKNVNTKGPQIIPLAQNNIQIATLLEQASVFMGSCCATDVASIFCRPSGHTYAEPYFSNHCTKVLSFHGHKLNAKDFRHMFATSWKDFIASPTTQLMGLTASQLVDAAASMMLNSPEAWAITYDDSTFDRGMQTILALWPRFLAFVEGQHFDAVTRQAWDPLTASMAELSL